MSACLLVLRKTGVTPRPKKPKHIPLEHQLKVNVFMHEAATGSDVSAPSDIPDARDVQLKKLRQDNAKLQEHFKSLTANQKSFVKVNANLTAQLQTNEAKSKQVESGKLGKLTKKDQVSFVCFWV